jgi:hypothetical protein
MVFIRYGYGGNLEFRKIPSCNFYPNLIVIGYDK